MSIYEIYNHLSDAAIDLDEDIQLILDEPEHEMRPMPYAQWYGDGKFEFIKSNCNRELLANAHEAVTRCELWGWLSKCNEDSFTWSNSPEVNRIQEYIFNTKVGQHHSGCSFGCTMREMEKIAKWGYEKYKQFYTSS